MFAIPMIYRLEQLKVLFTQRELIISSRISPLVNQVYTPLH